VLVGLNLFVVMNVFDFFICNILADMVDGNQWFGHLRCPLMTPLIFPNQ
jgi:hypothetical protein